MKKAIVVGATSGIGRELAILLADTNYLVGVTGRRKNLLDELKSQRPDHFVVSDFDLTEIFATGNKLEELTGTLGQLDLLILSSGTGEINEGLDFVIEKNTLDLNVTGFTEVADWAINYFQKQRQGHFAAITSVGGIRGSRHSPAYNASKAYQINYLEGLRQKLSRSGLPVYITDVRPGFVDTQMAKGDGKFWVAKVERAAGQILSAIEKRRTVVYVTRRWRLIAAILRIIPGWLYKRL
jgi:short-subunit dehydrogenase